MLAWLHLAVLAIATQPTTYRTWLTAAPILLFSTIVLAIAAIFGIGRVIGRHESLRAQLASFSLLGLVLLAFSSIPSLAFYAALSTMSGMYIALSICTIFWSLRAAAFCFRAKSTLGAPPNVPVCSDGLLGKAA